MQKVQMLQQCGVHPIIVFDGGKLPMKAAEEGTRSRSLAAASHLSWTLQLAVLLLFLAHQIHFFSRDTLKKTICYSGQG